MINNSSLIKFTVYSRPDIARFRMYTLPYYTLDNNDHTATVTTTIGPIISKWQLLY
jgi:hypothetical protein